MPKHLIIYICFYFSFTSISFSQIFRNEGKLNVSAGYLVVSGSFQNESASDINLDGIISLSGNWTNNSSSVGISGNGTNGEVVFGGTSTQTIGGTAAQSNFEKFTILPGAIVEIEAGKYVTAYGITSLAGTFNLKSSASGTASFIASSGVTGAGTTNFERHIITNQWHTLSSPVSGLSVSDFILNTANHIPAKGSTTYGMEFYDEPNGVWTYYTSANIASAGDFLPGVGYIVRRDVAFGDGVVTFSGNLNYISPIMPTLTNLRYGWNAVGNPYSSSIGINNSATTTANFIDLNTSRFEPSFAGIYVWNGTGGYSIINNTSPSSYVQPGQGFLIRIAKSSSFVSFNSDMQTHGNPAFYKKSNSTWGEIKLVVKSNLDSSMTRILFRDDMTKGLDISYDGGLYSGNSKLQLYSRLIEDNGVNFMIQCLPSIETDSMIIPIGLECEAGGLLTFKSSKSSLPPWYVDVLEDRLLGIYTDLSDNNARYEVVVEPGYSGTGRFFLHTVNAWPNNLKITNNNEIQIFAFQKIIYVKGWVDANTIASLYDIRGKKLQDFRLQADEDNQLVLNEDFAEGVYILKLMGTNTQKTEKVFIE
ncbi:MAG: T9SS type A sorting domain-containing protein [Bacteroidales bacterium]|nr:T9SS type A sorting domain-containing protein [Bacteroidales bacterium]MCB8999832.1 T9SS type A sorting domain-containing protein [Bacteroidales bacterium]MCB9012658.1 T9SS type A sorting domain-containing protein [Bacteroidales bacterium]